MKLSAGKATFFDRYVGKLISEKYGFDDKKAIRLFIESETYQMLMDVETEVYRMSPYILFDIWEAEKITGEPRNSQYIRSDLN